MTSITTRLLTAVLALALMAAACGDDGDATDTGDPTTSTTSTAPATTDAPDATSTTEAAPASTTTEPGALTASYRGVTAETIKVGILAFDWDRLAALGVEFGVSNNGDIYVAALEEINERGGIWGRMLEPVLTEFLPVGSTEADTACLELTEDEEVFVVIGTSLNEQILCITELHETAAVVANGMNEERLSRARAPYVTVIAPQERRSADFVELMTSTGVLDDATVGVIGSADVSETGFRAMVAALQEAGHDPTEGLIGGNADDLEQSAREQGLIYQRMDEAGVTVAVSTTGVPLEIANAFDAGYEPPQWLLSTVMTARGLRDAGVPLEYLDGALAVVNSATGTTAQPELADDPLAAACLDDLRARTDHELSYALETPVNNIGTGLFACSIATILEAGLRNAGTDLTNDSFLAGLEAIGEFDLPAYTGAVLGPGDYGAVKGLRLVRFDAASGAWQPYEG